MTNYTGRARNALARTLSPPFTQIQTRAIVHRVRPWGLFAWTVVGLAFLWFSCCGGVP